MARKVPLGQIPTPSTAILDLDVVHDGGALELRFEYDDEGAFFRSGVRFERTRATQWRAESHCVLWHIDGAYDTVAEVLDSPWVAQLRRDTTKGWETYFVLRHFMLYLDSFGCQEVIAADWSLLPVEPVP
jgi:hypothetical protein